MLGFLCRHCGVVEFLHQHHTLCDAGFMDGIVTYEQVSLAEEKYLKEIIEANLEVERVHKRGYHHKLESCPGFEHRKKDSGVKFIRAAFDAGLTTHHLPEELQEEAEKLYEEWECECEFGGYGQVHVYVAFNPRTGTSHIATGE